MSFGIYKKHSIIYYIIILSFIIFYPMLISIYVFLPLLIGLVLYIFVDALEKNSWVNMLLATIYMINLEVNLNLPIFLMLIIALLFYLIIFPYLRQFGECILCKAILGVILLDFIYFSSILLFDFIFETQSIVFDKILIYSLIVDILMVMII